MKPTTAAKLMSGTVLAGLLLAIYSGVLAMIAATGFLTFITLPLHVLAWQNKVNKW